MSTMSTATITSKGQITIPVQIRSSLGLQPGDKISFLMEESGRVVFLPATKDVTTLKGIVPRPARPVRIEDMEDSIQRGRSRR